MYFLIEGYAPEICVRFFLKQILCTFYFVCHHYNSQTVVGFSLSKEVNFEELARCTDDFNGAQLKAVCVEAVGFFLNFYHFISFYFESGIII